MAAITHERQPLWRRVLAFVGWMIVTSVVAVAATAITQALCLGGVRC